MRLKGTKEEQKLALEGLKKRIEGKGFIHYKGGEYLIDSVSIFRNARHPRLDGVIVVNYHSVVDNSINTRPLDEFFDSVFQQNGEIVKRFEPRM